MEPDLPLNCIKDTNKKMNDDYVVVLPNYFETKNKLYKEQHKEIIDKNGEYAQVGYDKKENLINHLKGQRNRHYRHCLDSTYE